MTTSLKSRHASLRKALSSWPLRSPSRTPASRKLVRLVGTKNCDASMTDEGFFVQYPRSRRLVQYDSDDIEVMFLSLARHAWSPPPCGFTVTPDRLRADMLGAPKHEMAFWIRVTGSAVELAVRNASCVLVEAEWPEPVEPWKAPAEVRVWFRREELCGACHRPQEVFKQLQCGSFVCLECGCSWVPSMDVLRRGEHEGPG